MWRVCVSGGLRAAGRQAVDGVGYGLGEGGGQDGGGGHGEPGQGVDVAGGEYG